MKVFKFSGSIKKRGYNVDWFYGNFVQCENDEIIGIMNNGESFIKGIHINNALIFIEITITNHINGYRFSDIKEPGLYDTCDWLSGLFSGESPEAEALIKVEEEDENVEAEDIKEKFTKFYESLDDWYSYYFDKVQELRDYLNM